MHVAPGWGRVVTRKAETVSAGWAWLASVAFGAWCGKSLVDNHELCASDHTETQLGDHRFTSDTWLPSGVHPWCFWGPMPPFGPVQQPLTDARLQNWPGQLWARPRPWKAPGKGNVSCSPVSRKPVPAAGVHATAPKSHPLVDLLHRVKGSLNFTACGQASMLP